MKNIQAKSKQSLVKDIPSLYTLNEGVKEYIRLTDNLAALLSDAASIIEKYFGKEQKVNLVLIPGDYNDNSKLFAEIQTELNAEEANKLLDKFDQDWWFKTSIEFRKYLEFSLEFI